MALEIKKVLVNRFEFSLDGGTPVSTIYPRALVYGNTFDFKTVNGANIIKKQNIDVNDITLVDAFGGGSIYNYDNVDELWNKLTELNFWGGDVSSGITTLVGLSDTPTYYANNGKVLQINEAQNRVDAVPFYNYKDLIELNDVSISALQDGKVLGVTNVDGVSKVTLIDKPTDGTTYFSAVGQFDYNDLATKTTPLPYTSGDLQLTNDTLGEFTHLSQTPYGITSVWDEETNTFDFSQLSIGDRVTLRIDIDLTTTASNQSSLLKILFGEGTDDEYTEVISNELAYKTAGEHQVKVDYTFDIRDNTWGETPAKLLFSSGNSAIVTVNGWAVYIIRKSINILDINDDNFKTLTVAQKASPLVDVVTDLGTVKVGYSATTNKINEVLFGKDFTKYLTAYKDLTDKKLVLKAYNKTKTLSIVSDISNMEIVGGSYMRVTLVENTSFYNVSVNDKLEFAVSVYEEGGSGGGTSSSSQGYPFIATSGRLTYDLGENHDNVDVWVGRIFNINYTYSNGVVTLDEAPEEDSSVYIRGYSSDSSTQELEAVDLQRSYSINNSFDDIQVHVGRAFQIPTIDYTMSNNIITFTYDLEAESKITIRNL